MIAVLLALALAEPVEDPSSTGPATSAGALEKLTSGKPLTARRLAEEVLAQHPDDFYAHHVVGLVTYQEEGNLPLAMYHLRKADKVFTRNRAVLPEDAWRTHYTTLRGIADVAQAMEDHDLFFDTVERHNELYNPKLLAEQGWVLMSAGRLDEARQVATEALASEEPWQRVLGLNVLCALEAKQRDRAAGLAACDEALEFGRTQPGMDLTVDAYNTSLAAQTALDFARADELLAEAQRGSPGGTTNPWTARVAFELTRGRGEAALAAVSSMQGWRLAQEPPTQGQSRAGVDALLGMVLWLAGEAPRGLTLLDRALAQPDRRAHTTATAGTTKGAHTVMRLALRATAREQEAEEACLDGLVGRMQHGASAWLPEPADWTDRWVVAGILQDPQILERTINPYTDDGLGVPGWMVGDLIPIVGPGVVQASVDRLRTLETHPGLGAYFDALEAEIAWRRGQPRTIELAAAALDALPEHEVLLKARVAAIAADHAWRRGDPRQGWALYEQAWTLDRSVFRRLGLVLPAMVQVSTSGDDDAIATVLGRSPRLAHDRDGFRVSVGGGRVCLASPAGNQLGCWQGSGPADDPDARIAAAVRTFHRDAFGMPLGTRRQDLRSLDGTTRVDDAARRQALDRVIDGL